MIDRWDDPLPEKNILRFEAELTKRDAIKRHLGKAAMQTNYKLLSTAAKNCKKVVSWYLKRLQPQCENYLRYEDAVRMVEGSGFKAKITKRMLYLLRKTGDKESLSAALNDLRVKYHISGSQCKMVLKKFKQLGISPITLTNASNFYSLPHIFL